MVDNSTLTEAQKLQTEQMQKWFGSKESLSLPPSQRKKKRQYHKNNLRIGSYKRK